MTFTLNSDEDSDTSDEEVAEEVCRQLQALFAHLQHSDLACYDPAALTSALSLNTSVQQDAQEVRAPAPQLARLCSTPLSSRAVALLPPASGVVPS